MSFFATVAHFAQVLVNWFWVAIDGSLLHRGMARLLYFPSILRMILREGPHRRWYDRIDDTVILGALPFRSQTKKVRTSFTYLCGKDRHPLLYAAGRRRESEGCAVLQRGL